MLRDLRNIGRLIGILWTLARFDALFPIDQFRLPPLLTGPLRLFARIVRRPSELRRGQRLSLALQTLGPSFIKLGQSLATRSDLVGAEIAADLSELQDRLPPFPVEAAIAAMAASPGNGGRRSCSSDRSAAISAPTRSERVASDWPSLMKLGPKACKASDRR